MKLGAENKKSVYWLAGLGVVAVYFFYSNVLSDSSTPAPAPAPKAAVVTERERLAAEATGTVAVPTPPRQLGSSRSRGDEFHPSLRSKRKEDQIDPLTVDPTLRLDLLAKVQSVKLEGGQRNLFQFGKSEPVAVLKGPEPIIPVAREKMGPKPFTPPPPPAPVVPPQPPPITMKYYGLATKRIDNKKTAFFLDGEDIILAVEGMTVKKHYRIVRISSDSVVVEDTDFKREQTVRISEDAGGTL